MFICPLLSDDLSKTRFSNVFGEMKTSMKKKMFGRWIIRIEITCSLAQYRNEWLNEHYKLSSYSIFFVSFEVPVFIFTLKSWISFPSIVLMHLCWMFMIILLHRKTAFVKKPHKFINVLSMILAPFFPPPLSALHFLTFLIGYVKFRYLFSNLYTFYV